ncbi:hypothetical protein HanRHA438_Chr07g0316511 [Helianthus annuus]|nr:hypothetical protein HanRHA438_Chr07g0316511 [Helianthus annuus]
MCRRHRTKGLRTILLKLGIVERLCYRPTKLSLGFLNWLPICFSLIKKVILIRLMLWGLLMMLLILFERFLFALSFGLIFLCLYNIKGWWRLMLDNGNGGGSQRSESLTHNKLGESLEGEAGQTEQVRKEKRGVDARTN